MSGPPCPRYALSCHRSTYLSLSPWQPNSSRNKGSMTVRFSNLAFRNQFIYANYDRRHLKLQSQLSIQLLSLCLHSKPTEGAMSHDFKTIFPMQDHGRDMFPVRPHHDHRNEPDPSGTTNSKTAHSLPTRPVIHHRVTMGWILLPHLKITTSDIY